MPPGGWFCPVVAGGRQLLRQCVRGVGGYYERGTERYPAGEGSEVAYEQWGGILGGTDAQALDFTVLAAAQMRLIWAASGVLVAA